jgi:hypothetical protein
LQVRRHLDLDATAVLGIAPAACEPLPLEPVEQRGHRAGAEPGPLREPAGGHRALLVEDVEAPERRVVDAEVLGDRVVERLARALRRPHRCDELPDQFVPRKF